MAGVQLPSFMNRRRPSDPPEAGQWGEYGTTTRYETDPETGARTAFLEANAPPPDPRLEDAAIEGRADALRQQHAGAGMGGSMQALTSGVSGGGSPSGPPGALLGLIQNQQTPPSVQHRGGATDTTIAFNRAKERAAQTARASLNALYDTTAASGRAGSPIEAGLAANVIQGGQEQLSEVARDQALAESGRRADVSDQSYQGDITQRGQNLSQQQFMLNLLSNLYNRRAY